MARTRTRKTMAMASTSIGSIVDVSMVNALEDRYLSYALSTITARALPDVRDGLKPVHRRILWAMRALKLDPTDQYKKCARIVGDVMGKFHPHGDSSIYEALVRQAQAFSLRYPLIDGQGNFGNIDGDSAAAMRYTESRMTEFGAMMMDGIDKDSVSFSPTYDGLDREPVVMPSAFPCLLANGTSGIAVGMATNIPSFNLGELVLCLRFILSVSPQQRATDLSQDIIKLMPGPDLATGGVLVEPSDSILESYKTGRGGFMVRAKWRIEKEDRNWSIVVYEIPYGIVKEKLVDSIGDLIENKKILDLESISDESSEDIQIRLTPRARTVNPDVLMERLFQLSALQTRIPLNLNVLDRDHRPGVMSIQGALISYIEHRREVLLNISHFRLQEIASRFEILLAQKIVFANLDAILEIIKESENPADDLKKQFDLSDRQVQYILDTRLRSLRRIEQNSIIKEEEALKKEADRLEKIVASEKRQDKVLDSEFAQIVTQFSSWEGWPRRTILEKAPEVEIPQIVEQTSGGNPITVSCSQKGWIKAVKGHDLSPESFAWREGDGDGQRLELGSMDKVVVFSSHGRIYNLPVGSFPLKGQGDPIRLAVDGLSASDNVIGLVSHQSSRVLSFSSDGYAIILEGFDVNRKAGRSGMTCPKGGSIDLICDLKEGVDSFAMLTRQGKLTILSLDEIATSRSGRGQKVDGHAPVMVCAFNKDKGLIMTLEGGQIIEMKGRELQKYFVARGKKGKAAPLNVISMGELA